MSAPASTDVVVIGAGPYGLSIAAHLSARGVRHRVFGPPMSAWRSNMPSGMFLKSPGRASNLSDPTGFHTLREYCRQTGRDYSDAERPISRDLFADYGDWFQKNLVPALDTRHVLGCERIHDTFHLQIEGGDTLAAKSVIISSGYIASAHVPAGLKGLPGDLVSHSSEHASLARFRNRDVVVIGAGQSALESAALLREAGARPTLVARSDILWGGPEPTDRSWLDRLRRPRTALGFGWRYAFYEHPSLAFHDLPLSFRKSQVDTSLGPLGAWWLRERVSGKLPLHPGWRLHKATPRSGRIVLNFRRFDGALDLSADHVIAATGYRVSPDAFPFLSPDLKRSVVWDHGYPRLSRHFESSVPGLHFIGVASAYAFGPAMRFVAGAPLTALRLSAYLAARHTRAAIPAADAPSLAAQEA